MLLELAVALSLTQIQDTCVIDTNSVFTRAYHVACAGNFNTWDDVIAFRYIANKEGFGGLVVLLRFRFEALVAFRFVEVP